MTEKAAAVGQYDVLIELAPPKLVVEKECAYGFYALFIPLSLGISIPVALATVPPIEVQVTVQATVTDREGKLVLGDAAFKSKAATPIRGFGEVNVTEENLGSAVEKALTGALEGVTLQLVGSPRFQQYAQALPRTTKQRPLAEAPVSRPPTPTREELLMDLDTPPQAKTVVQRHAYAVVVGIESYRDLPRADFAVHDAEVMASYLVKALGYPEENIILLRNERAGRTDLEKYFHSWLKNNVEQDSVVFVYYSGHGAPNPQTGEAYLVPYDGDPAYLDRTAYPLKSLYTTLSQLPTNQILVVLDSCFSGAGGRSVIAKGTRPMVVSVENPLLASEKVVVLAASTGEQISTSHLAQRHGLLTYFVLKGLKGAADLNQDRAIDVAELYTYLKPEVQRVARKLNNIDQVPQLLPPPAVLNQRGPMKLIQFGP
ncbi:MAG: caspase family protein [Nitrospirae bacterium]|nr:caspase family protein [Nitrospirota bacterium]